MRHYVLGNKTHPVSVSQAILELYALFDVTQRVSKNATGFVLTVAPHEGVSKVEYRVTDTTSFGYRIIDADFSAKLYPFVNRLLGTVITTQPYRDALYDFVRDDWLSAAHDRRLFDTIELRKQDNRVLLVVKGSSESPIYGMCYNTILEF